MVVVFVIREVRGGIAPLLYFSLTFLNEFITSAFFMHSNG